MKLYTHRLLNVDLNLSPQEFGFALYNLYAN
jgi:hypothetical protein